MNTLGKTLVIVGLVIAVIGLLLGHSDLAARLRLGRLPGDIRIHRGNSTFYFPITTCVILSLLITLILRLFRR